MRLLLLALLCGGLAACDAASPIVRDASVTADGVTFHVDRTEVRRGEAVALSLVNKTGHTLETGVFGCDAVERLGASGWERREADNDRACILPLYSIASGESYDGAFTLDVAPGTVRLVHTFNLQGEPGTSILSPPIRVR